MQAMHAAACKCIFPNLKLEQRACASRPRQMWMPMRAVSLLKILNTHSTPCPIQTCLESDSVRPARQERLRPPADIALRVKRGRSCLLPKLSASSAQRAPSTRIPLDQVFRCLLPSVIHTPRSSCLSAEHVLQACVHPHTTMTPALWHPVYLAADLNALDGFTKSSNNGYYSTSPECVAFSTSDPLSREQVCLSLC